MEDQPHPAAGLLPAQSRPGTGKGGSSSGLRTSPQNFWLWFTQFTQNRLEQLVTTVALKNLLGIPMKAPKWPHKDGPTSGESAEAASAEAPSAWASLTLCSDVNLNQISC